MAEMLRPMSTGELMDRTFTLYRRNFKLFVGIAVVGPVASLLFQLLMLGSVGIPGARGRIEPGAAASFFMAMLAGYVIMFAGLAISHAATVKAVAAVHLGLTTTIGQTYKSLKGKFLRVLGVFFTVAIVSVLAAVAVIMVTSIIGSLGLIGISRAGRAGAILGGLFVFALAIVGGLLAVAIMIRYALSVAACVVEDLGVLASMKRSAVLGKGSRGRILAVGGVLSILAFVINAVFSLVGVGVAALIPNVVIKLVITYIFSFVGSCLTGPLVAIGIALVYYDERVRKEAFDLQWMMASLDTSVLVIPAAAAAQS